MQHYATGIDDIATMNNKCSGWTYVTIDYAVKSIFDSTATRILREAELTSFHGKEFKRRKFSFYVEFLKLIRSTLESGPGFVSFTLLGQDWKSAFEQFCARVVGGSFAKAGIGAGAITEASKRLAAPLFSFQRLAENECQGGSTSIYLDRHVLYECLEKTDMQIDNVKLSSTLPIIAALRAYGLRRFPNAPEIERNSIYICPDEESFLIQAADIIGNFSTALAFRHLGRESKSNDLKCEAFEQAFGDIIDFSKFPTTLVRSRDELILPDGSGSFTFTIGGTGA